MTRRRGGRKVKRGIEDRIEDAIKRHLPSSARLCDSDQWDAEFGMPYEVMSVMGEASRGIVCGVMVHGRLRSIPFRDLLALWERQHSPSAVIPLDLDREESVTITCVFTAARTSRINADWTS